MGIEISHSFVFDRGMKDIQGGSPTASAGCLIVSSEWKDSLDREIYNVSIQASFHFSLPFFEKGTPFLSVEFQRKAGETRRPYSVNSAKK